MISYRATREEIKEKVTPEEYSKTLRKVLKAVERGGMVVSVRLEDISEDYTVLYGVFFKTVEEYQDYMSSGGVWTYVQPGRWLS